jgi:SPOR domain
VETLITVSIYILGHYRHSSRTISGKNMGVPINSPLTGDIWHLSIDDLLAPLPETQRLGGPGPFVINLSASSAPIDVPAKGVAGCEHVQVFLVQRIEDRRPRYRLRLGPFGTEDEAEAVLVKARATYPSALTATADAEDLRVMAAMQAKLGALPAPPSTAAPSPKPEVPRQTVSVAPVPAQIVPSLSLLAVPADNAPLALVPSPPRTLPSSPQSPSPSSTPIPTVTRAVPMPVPKAPQPAVRAAAIAPTPADKPVNGAPAPQKTRIEAIPHAATPPATAPRPVHLNKPLPNLDATQTVRALTQLELEGDQASRWFVIQLALAEEAFDPEVLPNLDIFNAYRLYSVAGIDQGRIVHALRMGFFSEEVGARAVASYLAAYYDNPTIKRVSTAERQRFADQRLEPRKDVGATGKQAVIEITNERFVRDRRSSATVLHKGR